MSKGLESFLRLKALLLINTKESKLTSILDLLNDVEKELKALEIIRPLVHLTKEQNHCWLWLGLNGRQITQEQYDLLKEVLKDETSNNDQY